VAEWLGRALQKPAWLWSGALAGRSARDRVSGSDDALSRIKINNGLVAEWLGRALQKLVQRFESARDLRKPRLQLAFSVFCFSSVTISVTKFIFYWLDLTPNRE
jgi:hypothetical protein